MEHVHYHLVKTVLACKSLCWYTIYAQLRLEFCSRVIKKGCQSHIDKFNFYIVLYDVPHHPIEMQSLPKLMVLVYRTSVHRTSCFCFTTYLFMQIKNAFGKISSLCRKFQLVFADFHIYLVNAQCFHMHKISRE